MDSPAGLLSAPDPDVAFPLCPVCDVRTDHYEATSYYNPIRKKHCLGLPLPTCPNGHHILYLDQLRQD